jgi:hypothetical protein
VTRRRHLDLELLLIIRRAERQARLLGGSPFNQPDAVIIVRSTERVTLTDLPVAQERASAACANSADEDSRIARPGLINVCSTGPMRASRRDAARGRRTGLPPGTSSTT